MRRVCDIIEACIILLVILLFGPAIILSAIGIGLSIAVFLFQAIPYMLLALGIWFISTRIWKTAKDKVKPAL